MKKLWGWASCSRILRPVFLPPSPRLISRPCRVLRSLLELWENDPPQQLGRTLQGGVHLVCAHRRLVIDRHVLKAPPLATNCCRRLVKGMIRQTWEGPVQVQLASAPVRVGRTGAPGPEHDDTRLGLVPPAVARPQEPIWRRTCEPIQRSAPASPLFPEPPRGPDCATPTA